jgi:hypothetical protein
VTLATLAGTLMLSRAVDDQQLSEELLAASRSALPVSTRTTQKWPSSENNPALNKR